LRWGPTPSACHRSLTLAALVSNDYPLSRRLRCRLRTPVTARSRSRRWLATTIRSVDVSDAVSERLSPLAHARGVD